MAVDPRAEIIADLYTEFGVDVLRVAAGLSSDVDKAVGKIAKRMRAEVKAIDEGYVYVYHGTSATNLQSILSGGLSAGSAGRNFPSEAYGQSGDKVFVTTDLMQARGYAAYAADRAKSSKGVIVKIRLTRGEAAAMVADEVASDRQFTLPAIRADQIESFSITNRNTGKIGKATTVHPPSAPPKIDLAKQQAIIREEVALLAERVRADTAAMAAVEQEFARRAVAAAVGEGMGTAVASTWGARAMAADPVIFGAPTVEWWKRIGGDAALRFALTVRQGIAEGKTLAKMTKEVEAQLHTTARNAKSLVRSAVIAESTRSRLDSFRKMGDVVRGVEQLSTLDSRTSDICIAYDGQRWDLDGNPIDDSTLPFNDGPPRHWNCRSTLVPVLTGLEGFPEIPTTRASEFGPTTAKTFEEWLKTKDEAYQRKVLGKTRFELWKAGKLSLRELVDFSGNPLKVAELRAKYEAPLRMAGGGTNIGWGSAGYDAEMSNARVRKIASTLEKDSGKYHAALRGDNKIENRVYGLHLMSDDEFDVIRRFSEGAAKESDSLGIRRIFSIASEELDDAVATMNSGGALRIDMDRARNAFYELKNGSNSDRAASEKFAVANRVSTYPEYLESILWHEFGHHVHDSAGWTEEYYTSPFRDSLSNIGPTPKRINQFPFVANIGKWAPDIFAPSEYGTSNAFEWWAESYAAQKLGMEVDQPAQSYLFLLEELKKIVAEERLKR